MSTWDWSIFGFLILYTSLYTAFLYRNHLVLRARLTLLYEDIDSYEKLPSYASMLFCIRKWPFKKLRHMARNFNKLVPYSSQNSNL